MTGMLPFRKAPNLAEFHAAINSGSDRWYAVCLRITRNAAMAEDAVQDGLVLAWSKRAQFQRGAKLDTWIHRIVVNAALQLLRRQRPLADDTQVTDIAVDEHNTPADVYKHEAMNAELEKCLAELTDLERICFVLKHIEQWRLKEIANELDTSVNTIKQGLFRGVRKLRVSMAHWRSEP